MRLIDYTVDVEDLRDPQTTVVFADIHEGGAGVDYELLRDDISAVKNQPNHKAIYLGDGTDAINKGDLKRFDYSSIHPWYVDPNHIERLAELATYQCKRLEDLFNPIRDTFIISTDGNHGEKCKKQYSYDPDRRFAEFLGHLNEGEQSRYSPGVVVLRLTYQNGKHKSRPFVIVAQHFCAGGTRSIEGNLNWMQNTMLGTWSDADVYLCGHVHKRGVRRVSRISIPRRGKMRMEPCYQYFGITGSYLRCYVDGVSNYGEGRYRPSDLGALRMVITPSTEEIFLY